MYVESNGFYVGKVTELFGSLVRITSVSNDSIETITVFSNKQGWRRCNKFYIKDIPTVESINTQLANKVWKL